MTEKINVFLTSAQKNKLSKGLTFQLSASQLQAGAGKHMVEIELPSRDSKKLLSNVSKNKGYRFTPNVVVGHGFFGNIAKSVLKSVAPTVIDFVGDKTGTRGLTDALKPSANGLIDLGVSQVGGRSVKGSPAMKERMAMLRGMRKGAGHKKMKMDMDMDVIQGTNVFDDIRNGFNRTFTPILGREIVQTLKSPVARDIYKGIIDVGAPLIGTATGTPILSTIAGQTANKLIDGMSIKRRKSAKHTMVVGGSLVNGVPHPIQMNLIINPFPIRQIGGSFLSAGGSFLSPGESRGGTVMLLKKGRGFRGKEGTLYGSGADSLIV
jgi:hypothetical protein